MSDNNNTDNTSCTAEKNASGISIDEYYPQYSKQDVKRFIKQIKREGALRQEGCEEVDPDDTQQVYMAIRDKEGKEFRVCQHLLKKGKMSSEEFEKSARLPFLIWRLDGLDSEQRFKQLARDSLAAVLRDDDEPNCMTFVAQWTYIQTAVATMFIHNDLADVDEAYEMINDMSMDLMTTSDNSGTSETDDHPPPIKRARRE